MTDHPYPWYSLIEDRDDLEQGDILDDCPYFYPVSVAGSGTSIEGEAGRITFESEKRDLIVLSQSCDLVAGREKASEVLLGTVWRRTEIREGYLATPRGLEDARRGNLPGVHLLAAGPLLSDDSDVRIVDFRRLTTLPVRFVRERCSGSRRQRLLPPYREHLSQAFARFFMRVGLPVDIPSFR